MVRMPPSTLTVDWPLQLDAKDADEYVLYLVKEPQVSVIRCR